MCYLHSPKICELFFEQCDNIICATCVSSGEKITTMKEDFKKDIQKLEEFFPPKYEAIVSKIPDQKAAFKKNSQKLN